MSAEAARETTAIVENNGGENAGILDNLGIDFGLFAAQLVNFLVVLLVLWRFAYKPLIRLMNERTEKIEGGLKLAKEMESRIAALEQEKAVVIKNARDDAKGIIERAEAAAQDRQNKATAKAKEEVEKVVAAGKAQLSADKDKMMSEAKNELASLVVRAAEKVAKDSIDLRKAEESAKDAVSAVL